MAQSFICCPYLDGQCAVKEVLAADRTVALHTALATLVAVEQRQ